MLILLRTTHPKTTFSSLLEVMGSVEEKAIFAGDNNFFEYFPEDWFDTEFIECYSRETEGKVEPIDLKTLNLWTLYYSVIDLLTDKDLFVIEKETMVPGREFWLQPYSLTGGGREECMELYRTKKSVPILNTHYRNKLDDWCDRDHEHIYSVSIDHKGFVNVDKHINYKIAYFHALRENNPILLGFNKHFNLNTEPTCTS